MKYSTLAKWSYALLVVVTLVSYILISDVAHDNPTLNAHPSELSVLCNSLFLFASTIVWVFCVVDYGLAMREYFSLARAKNSGVGETFTRCAINFMLCFASLVWTMFFFNEILWVNPKPLNADNILLSMELSMDVVIRLSAFFMVWGSQFSLELPKGEWSKAFRQMCGMHFFLHFIICLFDPILLPDFFQKLRDSVEAINYAEFVLFSILRPATIIYMFDVFVALIVPPSDNINATREAQAHVDPLSLTLSSLLCAFLFLSSFQGALGVAPSTLYIIRIVVHAATFVVTLAGIAIGITLRPQYRELTQAAWGKTWTTKRLELIFFVLTAFIAIIATAFTCAAAGQLDPNNATLFIVEQALSIINIMAQMVFALFKDIEDDTFGGFLAGLSRYLCAYNLTWLVFDVGFEETTHNLHIDHKIMPVIVVLLPLAIKYRANAAFFFAFVSRHNPEGNNLINK